MAYWLPRRRCSYDFAQELLQFGLNGFFFGVPENDFQNSCFGESFAMDGALQSSTARQAARLALGECMIGVSAVEDSDRDAVRGLKQVTIEFEWTCPHLFQK